MASDSGGAVPCDDGEMSIPPEVLENGVRIFRSWASDATTRAKQIYERGYGGRVAKLVFRAHVDMDGNIGLTAASTMEAEVDLEV